MLMMSLIALMIIFMSSKLKPRGFAKQNMEDFSQINIHI